MLTARPGACLRPQGHRNSLPPCQPRVEPAEVEMTSTARTADDGQLVRRTALGRALSVLNAFGPQHRLLSLSEIARRADLTLPTTHRLVSELVTWGALERHPSGHYFLGLRLLELAALAPARPAAAGSRLPLPRRPAPGHPLQRSPRRAGRARGRLCRDHAFAGERPDLQPRRRPLAAPRQRDRTGAARVRRSHPAGRGPAGPARALHPQDGRRPARATADPGRDTPHRRGHRPRPDHHARGRRRGPGARPPQRRHRGDQRGRGHQRDAAEPPRCTG